ncbi:N-carbamoyl-L-amino acid hydrolase [Klebsiella pneumoniae]|uniref:N-carbamoyl-L-amino acid hydrolase n=1 Tax=Klebsiella pneumoniae TaxID=573 RepID=A0A4P0Y943_KLEPN|nr:N-carbamoyl-L-amino acid hydrolase [Klebsiella pneumoniae]
MSDTVRQQAEREAAASRVMARADRLAALSETADALTRVYLSPEHLQANQLVGQWMQAADDGVAGQRRQHLRTL